MQASNTKDTQGARFSVDAEIGNFERRAFIGTTALWNVNPDFFFAMMRAQGEMVKRRKDGSAKVGAMFNFYAGEAPVGRSRNSLTAEFLKSNCTDLLFIDSDIIFSADHIERIVMHEEEVVGGIYPIKSLDMPPRLCLNNKAGVTDANAKGLIEVAYIGTGFLRVRRSVFEKMIAKYGDEIWYDTDNSQTEKERQYDFWKMGVYQYNDGSRRWLSEDWWFCQKCLDLGIPVYADGHVNVKHSGHTVFPLWYQEDYLFKKNLAANTAESAGASRMTSPLVDVPAPTIA